MEDFYSSLAMLTAGVALISGIINLLIGIDKFSNKAELLFGILSISVFIFLLLPPSGFIIKDEAPYSFAIIFKRVFIWTYYILLPWYIELHTGYRKRWFNFTINAFAIISYILMVMTPVDTSKPLWVLVTLIPFCLIMIHGFLAARYQMKVYGRKEGRSLLFAISIYSVLFMLGAINQLGNNVFGNLIGSKIFFPFNLNLLAFIAIMCTRVITTRLKLSRLERVLHHSDKRWDAILNNLDLMVIELDAKGNINLINPYAVQKLGYEKDTEIRGKNWFDLFIRHSQIADCKRAFQASIDNSRNIENFPEIIQARHNQPIMAKWSSMQIFGDQDRTEGYLFIGTDVTDQKRAYEQVESMKTELEKENLSLKASLLPNSFAHDIIGNSPVILHAIHKAKQVAITNAGILLTGETGTGKELFVNLIHKQSYRSNEPLVKVNCAALPAELIESELFGHEKGAFTGALQKRKGRFEMANGGTIFLDEIGELPLSLQPKLLRVLQNGEFERIGGTEVIKVNVRVVAATNRDLLSEVKKGKFREDLYYRLNVYPIHIPALRDRSEDIEPLVIHYTSKFAQENQKTMKFISKADMIRLKENSWPGNIRELINVVERSVISSQGETIRIIWSESDEPGEKPPSHSNIEEIERQYILKILTQCDWKINGEDGAAAILGLHPSTLRSRLKKMRISRNGNEVAGERES